MAFRPETKKARSLSLAGIAQISNDISRKFLDRSDLSRLLRIASNFIKDHTQVLVELDSFFVYDPTAKIKLVFVEDSVLVKNIFIMSSSMQELAEKYPENLYIDFLSNIGPGLNLYSVSCEDDAGWKICACCLSKTNNQDTLRFLVVSVLQSIPTMKAQIKSLIIHPEISDSLDLSTLLPNATVRHCMLLILKVLEQKTTPLQLESQTQIKSILQAMVHARSLKVYNRHLHDLKASSPAEFYQYYIDTWHPSRKLWCTKDSKRIRTEKSIHAYVASLHYTLLSKIGILPSLYQCLHVILRQTHELKSVPEELLEVDSQPVFESPSDPVEEATEYKKNELEQMEFYSWEDFQSFLNIWCEEQKIIFVIRNSIPLSNEDVSNDLMQSLKYSMVNLGCSSYTRKRCPATIQLRLGPQMDKLIITKADLNHSHDSEIDLPSRFTRKPVAFVEVPATKPPDAPDKFMDRSDLTKLLHLHFPFGRESQFLDELESIFNTDPDVKVKLVYLDDKFTVKNIFFMTTGMQTLLQQFPEHLYVAFLPGLNQEFDLYSVFCQDEHFKWKVCAYCLARKQSQETFRFLLLSILQVHSNLSKQVRFVTLNPDILNHVDAKPLFPNAIVKLCLPFVFEFMHHKMTFLSQMEKSQIKKLLVSLSQATSTETYTQHLSDLKAACPDEVFQYYFEIWHPLWPFWSGKDNRTTELENTIFNYVKEKHEDLKAQLGSLPTLSQCLHALLMEDESHVQEQTESKNASLTEESLPVCETPAPSIPINEESSPGMEQTAECEYNQECEDPNKMQINGKEFESWDEFCAYLQGLTKETYNLRFTPLTEEDKTEVPSDPNVNVSLKYSWVQLFCSWKNCLSSIELTLGPQKDKLIVIQSNFEHNHVDEDTMEAPPEKRFKPTPAVGVPAQVANNISKKFLEPSDIKRLLRFRSGAFEDRTQVLAELQSLFFSDPEAKVKLVFVEDKLHVKKIFLMTSVMRNLAQNFPEYLFIDVFLEFSHSFDLYTVFCDVKGEGWTPCAYCIAKKGIDGIFKFLSDLLLEIIPTIANKVKLVTLNPDIREQINPEAQFPHANLRYCMHLVLNVMYSRIVHLDATAEAQIKNFLHILSQTCSIKVYERYLNDLKAVCPREVFQYYFETWHPRRKMWVKKDNRTEETERNLSELVSVNHVKLKQAVGYMPSLHQCLCSILGNTVKAAGNDLHIQRADIMSTFCDYEKPTAPLLNQEGLDGSPEQNESGLQDPATENSTQEVSSLLM
ncbi:Chromosome 19 open reading frame 68, partial [Pristimantis euphronides]